MTAIESIEEAPEGWTPKVIQGGKTKTGGNGPPEAPVENWIKDLQRGTVFCCRQHTQDMDWECYTIMHKFENIYLLNWEMPDGKVLTRRVHPEIFCKRYRDYEVVAVFDLDAIFNQEPPKEAEGDNND